MKYTISGKNEHNGGHGWAVLSDNAVIGVVTGPGSLSVALAACELLESKPNFFEGWLERAQKLMPQE